MPRLSYWNILGSKIDIPKGIITLFVGNSCPVGWEEVDELQGRIPIGAGGIAGIVLGSSLDRPQLIHTHELQNHDHTWDATSSTAAYNGLCTIAPGVESDAACGHTHPIFAGTSTISGSGTLTDYEDDLKNIFGGTFCRKL